MNTTMDLLEKALKVKRASHWADELELSNATFTMASKRGRLSPTIAGNLAIKLGENPEHWMAIAAMEAEPDSPLLANLRHRFAECRFSSMLDRRKNNKFNEKHRQGAFFMPGCFDFADRRLLPERRL